MNPATDEGENGEKDDRDDRRRKRRQQHKGGGTILRILSGESVALNKHLSVLKR